MWGKRDTYLKASVERIISEATTKAIGDALGAAKDGQKVVELKKQIAQLEIDRDKKNEEFDRREREVEHKVGLERKRQEFEIEQSRRETTVKVREENLSADKERFKAEMDFQRKHLESEIGSLRELVGKMLERLPSAEIIAEVKRDYDGERVGRHTKDR